MDAIKKYYFITLSLFPLLQFVSYEYLDGFSFSIFYGALGILIYFVFLLSGVNFKYPKYIFPLILLAFYYFIWEIVNGEITSFNSLELINHIYHFRWFHIIFFLILIENTYFDDSFIQIVIIILKITIIIAFIVTLVQLLVNPFFLMPLELRLHFLSRSQYEIRLQSIFGYLGSNDVGYSFIPIMSILVGYYLVKNKPFNIIWLLMAGIVFFGTKTRFIYLNYFIILLQYPLVKGLKIKKTFKIFLFSFLSLIVIIFVLQSVGFNVEEFIQKRLLSESASTRLLVVEMFVNFFPKNPFFGAGIHVGDDLVRAIGGRSSQMHVGYLSHLYEYGIIGTILLFYFLVLILKKFYMDSRITLYYGSLFAFGTIFITNLTLVHFSIYNYGLLFSFVFNKYINDQYHSENVS